MPEEFFESIERLLSMKTPEEVSALLKEAERQLNGVYIKDVSLTKRETDILSWLAHGKTAWEIGTILHISRRTVEWHTRNAAKKLNAVNALQAVAKAIKIGLIV
jgi:LuxR family transcriptional activator of bioluminescence operon